LLKVEEGDYVLIVNTHHIVMDGWSKGIMLKELITLYEAFSEGKPSPLSELPVRYTDYAYWHHEWLQGKMFESQLAYLKEKLSGAPPVLELPLDYPRPNIAGGRGSMVPFTLSTAKLQELKDTAKKENVTLFMVLMSAYIALLYRYSGMEDIIVGTPVAGRHRVELEPLIGLFVNLLAIRNDLSGDPTFKELLNRVRNVSLEAFSHQDVPFDKLVEELNPQRNLSINPIFQVMFQLQNSPMPPVHIHGLTVTPIQIDTGVSQVDLSLTMWEEEGIMKGTFEYDADLFDHSTIKRMTGHFLVLLDGIIQDASPAISRMPLLSEEEVRRLLVEWNDTHAEYPCNSSIDELFDSCVEKNRSMTAVIFGEKRMTYEELHREASRLAYYLKTMNIGPGSFVGICMDNSLELIVGIMGILKAGGAYIPMDPQYPDRRLNIIVKDSAASVVLTQEVHLKRFGSSNAKIIPFDAPDDLMINIDVSGDLKRSGPRDAACVVYTSGSTGEPKGIIMENRGIVNLIYSFIRSYSSGSGDSILPLTSIASASFVGEILPILTSGGSVVLADKVHFLEMKKLVALMSLYNITILSTVPSMIARLNAMKAGEWNPGKLRLLLSGGEALSLGDIDRLMESVTIVNGYGLTEATVCSTYIVLNSGTNRENFIKKPVISVGKPIVNTQVFILDKRMELNVQPIGVPGEIYIGGDGLSRGYLNRVELTNEKFVKIKINKSFLGSRGDFSKKPLAAGGIFYKTGDLACWLSDGNIKFLGRIDTQVQVHGYRIELSEIETNLGLHPEIKDVVVIDREVVVGDRRLVAYIVVEEGKKFTSNELREWLEKRVPGYMIPAVFEKVESIPLTVNGKVDVNALPVPSWERPELDVAYKAPQTEIERSIAAIWQEFLGLDKIGIHDNFFDLGGHSLLLTQVHSRLAELYGNRKEITIVDLFRYPTLHSLSKYIGEEGKSQNMDSYRKIQDRASKQRQAFMKKSKN
jgi:amino acid adenylation domain-containing protein